MKTKLYISISLLGASLMLNSCTDMSENVYSSIVSENFKPTEKDVMSVMGPSYTAMQDLLFGWTGGFDCQEECSDELVTPARPNGWVDGGVYRTMHEHNWNSLQAHCGGLWSNCFRGINNCNRSLYQIESGELPVSEGKERYIAELRSMRALYYWYLLDNFRNVPLVDKYDVPDDFLPTQSDAKSIYAFIEKELKESVANLSDAVDKSTYGRMTVYSAKFLLAKLYLNAKVYIGESKWNECEALCTSIMTDNKFTLENNYKNIFLTENEACKEIILAVPFDEKYGGWFHLHNKTLHPSNQKTYNLREQPWGGCCAIPQFIDTYDKDDSRLADTWIMGPQYDMSGNQLLCVYGDDKDKPLSFVNVVPGVEETREGDGYRVGKYEIKIGALGALSNDFPLFRYADVYMMKAECLLRNGNADDAAKLITDVRKRSFKNNPSKATVTGADLLKGSSYNYGHIVKGVLTEVQGGSDVEYGRMLDELGWEFAAEIHRRVDQIRFGVFTTKKWLSKTRIDQPYRAYFPIPESQLKKNPNLKQNDGYK